MLTLTVDPCGSLRCMLPTEDAMYAWTLLLIGCLPIEVCNDALHAMPPNLQTDVQTDILNNHKLIT